MPKLYFPIQQQQNPDNTLATTKTHDQSIPFYYAHPVFGSSATQITFVFS